MVECLNEFTVELVQCCSSWCSGGVVGVSHGEMFPDVLFAGKSLSTDMTREWLWVDVCPAMDVETAALCELFAARVTREWLVARVSTLV